MLDGATRTGSIPVPSTNYSFFTTYITRKGVVCINIAKLVFKIVMTELGAKTPVRFVLSTSNKIGEVSFETIQIGTDFKTGEDTLDIHLNLNESSLENI